MDHSFFLFIYNHLCFGYKTACWVWNHILLSIFKSHRTGMSSLRRNKRFLEYFIFFYKKIESSVQFYFLWFCHGSDLQRIYFHYMAKSSFLELCQNYKHNWCLWTSDRYITAYCLMLNIIIKKEPLDAALHLFTTPTCYCIE